MVVAVTEPGSAGHYSVVSTTKSYLLRYSLYMIHGKWQLCIECCIEHFVSSRTQLIVIPQFQATESDRVLFKSYFVNKHLPCRLYSHNITNAEIANEANPLTMTNLGFALPDLHSGKEPLCIRIP